MTESVENGLNRQEIGLRIRSIRGERSQKEFAELTGATQSYISDLERGKCFPSVTFLARLSDISGRSFDWILSGKEELEGPPKPAEPAEPAESVEPEEPVEAEEPVEPPMPAEPGPPPPKIPPPSPAAGDLDYAYLHHLVTVLSDAPPSEKTRFLKIIVSYLHTYL